MVKLHLLKLHWETSFFCQFSWTEMNYFIPFQMAYEQVFLIVAIHNINKNILWVQLLLQSRRLLARAALYWN